MEDMECPSPWESNPEIWKTKAAFFTWMRGSLRRGLWEKYPPKIQFKNSKCSRPPQGYTGRAKTGAYCALTGDWEGKSKLQVDHIKGNASLKDWEDVEGFIAHLCSTEDNLQLVTKEAHYVKSYAERWDLSFEEALVEKQVIKFMKNSVAKQKSVLKGHGVPEDQLSNAGKRKDAIRSIMQGN